MITFEKGNFGKDDKIIFFHGIKVTLEEAFKLLIELRDNEARRDWDGKLKHDGSYLFKRILWKIQQGATFEQLEPYIKSGFIMSDFENAGFNYKEWEPVYCDRCCEQAFCSKCNKFIWKKRPV